MKEGTGRFKAWKFKILQSNPVFSKSEAFLTCCVSVTVFWDVQWGVSNQAIRQVAKGDGEWDISVTTTKKLSQLNMFITVCIPTERNIIYLHECNIVCVPAVPRAFIRD